MWPVIVNRLPTPELDEQKCTQKIGILRDRRKSNELRINLSTGFLEAFQSSLAQPKGELWLKVLEKILALKFWLAELKGFISQMEA